MIGGIFWRIPVASRIKETSRPRNFLPQHLPFQEEPRIDTPWPHLQELKWKSFPGSWSGDPEKLHIVCTKSVHGPDVELFLSHGPAYHPIEHARAQSSPF